jgi:lysozyme family protein
LGISKRTFPHVDIKNLDYSGALKIYQKFFWEDYNLESIKSQKIANAVFDFIINAAPRSVIKCLQEAMAFVMDSDIDVDGIMGNKTLSMLNSSSSPYLICQLFTLNRIKYYSSIILKDKTQVKYFHGWVDRALRFS